MKPSKRLAVILGLMTGLCSTLGWSLTREIALDFQDSQIRGHNVLTLKRALRDQYPELGLRGQTLKQVILVAKTRYGKGQAFLRIGDWVSRPQQVQGHPAEFGHHHYSSFYRKPFRSVPLNSRGRWQLELMGNFKVRKVILVLEDHRQMSDNWWRPVGPRPYYPEVNSQAYPSWKQSRSGGKMTYQDAYFADRQVWRSEGSK